MSKKKTHLEPHKSVGSRLRDFILGFQDGLVNVLGIVLAVAVASQDFKIIMIAGLAAAFAESISMAAVGYTPTKSEEDYYKSEVEREKWEIKNMPDEERKEIRDIYYKKGFRGKLLKDVVKKITSNKKVWLETMMKEELGLVQKPDGSSVKSAEIIGISAIIGSIVPLIPFLFMPVSSAIFGSVIFSTIILFSVGLEKARLTTKNYLRSGVEIALIGIASALIGYSIGFVLGVVV